MFPPAGTASHPGSSPGSMPPFPWRFPPTGAAMSILVTCKCGKHLEATDDYAGRQAKCPACGRILVMPAKTAATGQTSVEQNQTGAAPSGSATQQPAPSSATTAWYYKRGYQQIGPVSLAVLRQLVSGSYLTQSSMLLPVGSEKWITADSVSGLFDPPQSPSAHPPAAGSSSQGSLSRFFRELWQVIVTPARHAMTLLRTAGTDGSCTWRRGPFNGPQSGTG